MNKPTIKEKDSLNIHLKEPYISPPVNASLGYYQGPIPPPNFLEQYEKLVPGIANRFLNEPHIEAEHRRALEKQALEEKINFSKRGQWMAFTIAVLCLIGSFSAIALGHSISGLTALFGSIAAFAGVFIYDNYRSFQTKKNMNKPQEKSMSQ